MQLYSHIAVLACLYTVVCALPISDVLKPVPLALLSRRGSHSLSSRLPEAVQGSEIGIFERDSPSLSARLAQGAIPPSGAVFKRDSTSLSGRLAEADEPVAKPIFRRNLGIFKRVDKGGIFRKSFPKSIFKRQETLPVSNKFAIFKRQTDVDGSVTKNTAVFKRQTNVDGSVTKNTAVFKRQDTLPGVPTAVFTNPPPPLNTVNTGIFKRQTDVDGSVTKNTAVFKRGWNALIGL